MAERTRVGAQWMVRGTMTAAVFLGGVLWIAMSGPAPVSAEPKFLPGFAEAYPEAAASALNGCLLCHTSPSPSDDDDSGSGGGDGHGLNPYGDDWEERGDKDFRTIEDLDSDRDGFSNRVEIQALSFPGDPTSTPLTVTTTTTQPGTPPDGAALYAASCAACHGPGGGNLIDTRLNETQFSDIVVNGLGAAMPAFGSSLSATDVAAIHAYLTGAPPPPPPTTTAPGTPSQAIDAAALFNSTCSGCHGSDGGNLVPTALMSPELISVITNGQAGMPGYGSSLSVDQISAIAAYLLDQSASPAASTTTTRAPGTPPRSGASVWTASCAGCHGPEGGDVAGTTMSRSQLVSVINTGTGSMPGFEGRLSNAEIEAVADYLRARAESTTTTAPGAEPDGASIYMLNCSVCHGPHGEGGSGGAIVGSDLNLADIEMVIANGTGTMRGFSSKLGGADMAALVDHVAELVAQPTAAAASNATEEADTAPVGVVEATPTSEPSVGAGSQDQALRAAASPPPIQIPVVQEERPAPAGSPWLPVLPILAAVTWLAVDAVRSGQLAALQIRRPG